VRCIAVYSYFSNSFYAYIISIVKFVKTYVRATAKGCYIHFKRQAMLEDVAIPPRELLETLHPGCPCPHSTKIFAVWSCSVICGQFVVLLRRGSVAGRGHWEGMIMTGDILNIGIRALASSLALACCSWAPRDVWRFVLQCG